MLTKEDILKHNEWIALKAKEGKHRPFVCREFKKAAGNVLYDNDKKEYYVLDSKHEHYVANNWNGELLKNGQPVQTINDLEVERNSMGCPNCNYKMTQYDFPNIPEQTKTDIEDNIEDEKSALEVSK